MADFSTPFASSGDLRNPTTDEKQTGFACGPADRALFNRLINRLESELGAIVDEAGVTPSESDDTTVLQAIQALIEAATGGGDTSGYLTMAQARARLQIFPEVQTSDGKMGVTAPSTGQVRIPAGKTFIHRGVYTVTTTQTDFATSPSKMYHMRWNPDDGYTLNDLADTAVYNPSALPEVHPNFDSTYDDMLFCRVQTNSSNVATITNISNLTRLSMTDLWRGVLTSQLNWTTRSDTEVTLNWARTPIITQINLAGLRSNDSGPSGSATPNSAGTLRALEVRIPSSGVTRYKFPNFEFNYEDNTLTDSMAEVNRWALAV